MLRGSGNEGAGDALANLDNNDSVTVTISANTHLVAMRAIANAINNSASSLIVVANDDSGGTEYLTGSGISACGTISVAVAYAN
jgi:N-dimethylarginine dimethylaminohydrolase